MKIDRNLANYITFGRMILAIVLLILDARAIPFYVVYVLCGLSDMLDGYIARKFKIVTDFGGKLDSIADILFCLIALIKILPVLNLELWMWIWIAVIALFKVICISIVCLKHGTFGMLHTHLNKAAGLLLFISPIMFAFFDLKLAVFYVLAGTCSLSVFEELIIDLTERDLDLNTRGIFYKLNNK